jgi:hypothetical protein
MNQSNPKKQEEKTGDGKNIVKTEHADGRKDVEVQVNSLDVDLSDPRNKKAKEVIEERILPKIAQKQVTVTVIHTPTLDYASFVCQRQHVRDYTINLIDAKGGERSEYCAVENDGDSIKVTSV